MYADSCILLYMCYYVNVATFLDCNILVCSQ